MTPGTNENLTPILRQKKDPELPDMGSGNALSELGDLFEFLVSVYLWDLRVWLRWSQLLLCFICFQSIGFLVFVQYLVEFVICDLLV